MMLTVDHTWLTFLNCVNRKVMTLVMYVVKELFKCALRCECIKRECFSLSKTKNLFFFINKQMKEKLFPIPFCIITKKKLELLVMQKI